MTDPAAIIWVHVIAAIPPTLAAVAALITALRVRRDTQKIVVMVNGRIDGLLAQIKELEHK